MFTRRWLINYLLFVLIIIFTWIGMKYPITPEQMGQSNAITSIKPQDIEHIKIETADAIIDLDKQAGNWDISSPISWPANNIAVERLTTLASLQAQSELPNNEIDLSTLGLSLPKAVITLNQQRFAFGDSNRIGNRRYLASGSKVYLVDDIHFPFIKNGIYGLLDKRLLPASLGIKALQLTNASIRREQGKWVARAEQADSQQVDQLIDQWQRLEASAIRAYDTSLTPLSKIKAETEAAGSIEFYLMSIKPEIILARPDLKLQYHFADYHYYDLLAFRPAEQTESSNEADK
jgi:hypothetical protein